MKYIILLFVTLLTFSTNAQTVVDYLESGLKKVNANDFKGALVDLSKAITESTKEPEVNMKLLAKLYEVRASTKEIIEDYYGAVEDWTKSIEIDPQKAEAYSKRGVDKNKLKDNKGAIEDYTRAIELNPKYKEAYYGLGNVKLELQDYQGAIDDFTKAIELDINYENAYITRCIAKINLKNFEGAIEDVNKAIIINPGNEKALELLNGTKKMRDVDNDIKTLKMLSANAEAKKSLSTETIKPIKPTENIYNNSKPARGTIAPDFTQTDVYGNPVSLSSFRGKYVLIHFWASWSDPCMKENPDIAKAYRAFKQKNFEIIGISLDSTTQKDKWQKAIQDQQLNWIQLCDFKGWNNEVAKLYHVNTLPMNFLLDPDGKVYETVLSGDFLKFYLPVLFK